MRAAIAVATREVRERWMWLGLSLTVGLVPLLGAGIGIPGPAAQAQMATNLAGFVALLSSIVLGASVMAGDLVQGRLGFLLARPISWWSVWTGKLIAALVLSGISVVACGPALVSAYGWAGAARLTLDPRFVLFVSCIVIGTALAQAITIAFRSRSGWLIVDLAATAAAIYFGAHVLAVLELSGVFTLDASTLPVLVGGIAAVLLVLTAAPFAFGGASLHRAHTAASLASSIAVLAALTAGAGWGYWAAHPRSEDFSEVLAVSANKGWIRVIGYARGRDTSGALFSWEDDRRAPRLVGSSLMLTSSLAVSADGSTAAWLEAVPGIPRRARVTFARTAGGSAAAEPLPVPPSEVFLTLILSANGDRLAVQNGKQLRVYGIPKGNLLADITLPVAPAAPVQAAFRGDDTVMVYGRDANENSMQIQQASVSTGRATVTGHMELAGSISLDAAGQKLLATDFGGRRVRLHDATSGALVAPLTSYVGVTPASVFIGGAVAVLQNVDGRARLQLFSNAGQGGKSIDLGPAARVVLQVDRHGNLLAGLERAAFRDYETVVISVPALDVLQRLPGLVPAHSSRREIHATLGRSLFWDAAHRVVAMDDAGHRQVVFGPRG